MTTTVNRRCRLAEVVLPDFGMPSSEPLLPASIYRDRMERLRSAMEVRGYDHIVVWADREHSANIAYLTGFDPRFEEAALVVGTSSDPAILVGNECYGLAEAAPLTMRLVRFQDLSLPGQPRSESRPLPEILSDEGIGPAGRVGVVGWKTYSSRRSMEAPAFLIDELRRATGSAGLVENACDLLIDPIDGLRVTNEVEQLAAFEWAAC
ncbi:MAG: aminopeptidase P family N-terminal domain-containing protein, partial [Ilumatobacteraceae bacterium]